MKPHILICASIFAFGCAGGMTPAQQAKFDLVDCIVHKLAPLALTDAERAASDLSNGLDLSDVADAATVAKTTWDAVKTDVAVCKTQFNAPLAPDAGLVSQ